MTNAPSAELGSVAACVAGTDAVTTSPLLHAVAPAAALAVLLTACGSGRDEPPAASSSTAASSAVPQPTTPSPTPIVPATPQPSEAPPSTPLACDDDDLEVAAGPLSEDGTLRRVDVTFTNTSPKVCVLVSYPGADLVTAAGGVLVHVARRPANAAPHLELQPNQRATADVQASGVDNTTGEPCGRIGTLVVTAPNTTESHVLPVNLPICDATISAVG